jgi:hypothetical protein
MIPGCQLFACTDTSQFPGAVVFPAIGGSDWNMEAAGVGAWTGVATTLTKEGGAYTGARCLRLTYLSNTVLRAYQGVFTSGNRYRVTGVGRSDGSIAPRFWNDSTAPLWVGTTSTDWQPFDITFTADGIGPTLTATGASAGKYVEFDDVVVTLLNASQLTDLNGTGHHLVQATAARQPLFVASGAGGYLQLDGTADWLEITDAFVTATFGGADPAWTVIHCGKLRTRAASETMWGVGNTGRDTPYMRKYTLDGASAVRGYKRDDDAVAAFGTVDTIANTNTHFFADVNAGTTWQHWIDTTAAAAVAVDVGAMTLTHLTLGAHRTSGAAEDFCPEDVWAWGVWNRALSTNDLARIYRWSQRLRGRLAL